MRQPHAGAYRLLQVHAEVMDGCPGKQVIATRSECIARAAIKVTASAFDQNCDVRRVLPPLQKIKPMKRLSIRDWPDHRGTVALWLRLGLGAVFVIGGWSKLSQLLDPARAVGIVSEYVGSAGYINAFFLDYLFEGPLGVVLTPWGFLTTLSSFELLSGILLLAGLLVRPLALLYAFLLWSFVFSLPVVTTPGVVSADPTYTSPALFVQVRDVALSGMMFVLFNLGAGRFSVDGTFGRGVPPDPATDPEALGLLLRLSLAAPLLVGGFFAGMANIQSFALFAPLLVLMGVALVSGIGVRTMAIVGALGMLWFMATKISVDKSLIANLNGFKREFALMAGFTVLAVFGGGERFVWWSTGTPTATRRSSPRLLGNVW